MTGNSIMLHGVAMAVAVDPDGPLAGIIVLGEAGSGKSSLALALIDGCPFHRTALVADDVVLISVLAGRLVARAPKEIAGLVEVRGFGPATVKSAPAVTLALAVRLDDGAGRVPAAEAFQPIPEGPIAPLLPFWRSGADLAAAPRLRTMLASVLSGQIS